MTLPETSARKLSSMLIPRPWSDWIGLEAMKGMLSIVLLRIALPVDIDDEAEGSPLSARTPKYLKLRMTLFSTSSPETWKSVPAGLTLEIPLDALRAIPLKTDPPESVSEWPSIINPAIWTLLDWTTMFRPAFGLFAAGSTIASGARGAPGTVLASGPSSRTARVTRTVSR